LGEGGLGLLFEPGAHAHPDRVSAQRCRSHDCVTGVQGGQRERTAWAIVVRSAVVIAAAAAYLCAVIVWRATAAAWRTWRTAPQGSSVKIILWLCHRALHRMADSTSNPGSGRCAPPPSPPPESPPAASPTRPRQAPAQQQSQFNSMHWLRHFRTSAAVPAAASAVPAAAAAVAAAAVAAAAAAAAAVAAAAAAPGPCAADAALSTASVPSARDVSQGTGGWPQAGSTCLVVGAFVRLCPVVRCAVPHIPLLLFVVPRAVLLRAAVRPAVAPLVAVGPLAAVSPAAAVLLKQLASTVSAV